MTAKRVIILWSILIALFVAFYQVFSRPRGADAEASAPRDVEWSPLLTQWLPIVVVLGGVFLFVRYQQKRYTPFVEAHRLAAQGRHEQSLDRFEAYRKAYPKDAEAAFWLGTMQLTQWRLGAARLELEAARKLKPRKPIPFLAENLALTHALLGDPEEARRALTDAAPGKRDEGRSNLVLAMIFVREGSWAMAREKLGSFEVKQLSGVGGFARALDAWCIEQLTGERRHLDRLAVFGGARPDELEKTWPEFMAFVERAPAW